MWDTHACRSAARRHVDAWKSAHFGVARCLLTAARNMRSRFLSLLSLLALVTFATPALAQPTSGACEPGSAGCPLSGVRAVLAAADGAPEIPATEKAMGEWIVKGMQRANTPNETNPDIGIHYTHNYEAFFPDRFRKTYWNGYASGKYWERQDFMTWRLKDGVSASEALASWLKGRTIAECLTALQAIQTDALRAAVGNKQFDELFGKKGRHTPEEQRLIIGPGFTSVTNFMKGTGNKRGRIGKRNVKVGEHYYIYNHPMYLLKHPGGAFQGENAIYDGEKNGVQMWSGFGVTSVSERGMLEEMVSAYNQPRDDRDLEVLRKRFGKDEKKWPKEYREDGGVWPKRITVKDLLEAKPYEIDGTLRKGGFVGDSGYKLDTQMVKMLRNATLDAPGVAVGPQ